MTPLAESSRRPVPKPEVPQDFSVREVRLAGNRGACGGVEMTLEAVRQIFEIVPPQVTVWTTNTPINFPLAFERYGKRLKSANGDMSVVPDKSVFIISAHGASPEVFEEANQREMIIIDVTCPLVRDEQEKVREAKKAGAHIIFLGEEKHPETVGIKGQVPTETITVLDPSKPIPDTQIPDGSKVFAKTTNDPEQTAVAIEQLRTINPSIDASEAHSCYALRNRYAAGKALIGNVDYWLVVGDQTSHNAKGIRDIALGVNLPHQLVRGPEDIDWSVFGLGTELVGVSSAASVPEEYTQRVLDSFRSLDVPIREMEQEIPETHRVFRLPEAQIEILRQMYVPI
jgi:4-hydroxy-3-methylbut-2-en-1-yl diphosphate reductase